MTLTTATARTLLAPLDDSGGRAELVARRLGDAIRLGLLLDGERLPPEARLAELLGVAPATLREALAMLRAEALVTTRRGRRGGTFVHAAADPCEALRAFSVTELRDLGDHRLAIAGAAARLAAERVLADEVGRLREQLQRLRAAPTASERRRADAQFSIAVAAAAQSPRLTREEARLHAEVGDLLALGTDDHEALVRDRVSLVDAIAARRSNRARRLAERQVAAETARLIRLRLRS
jgi:GntR family transcriptional repressor for pyruvate dehydrogenase complex